MAKRRRSKRRVSKRRVHKRKKAPRKNVLQDVAFSLILSLATLGVLTLSYIAQGLYLHLANTLTLFAFVFVSLFLIKHTHGVGKSQAFYSAMLASFGYFVFYRVYNYFMLGDPWRTSAIMGDSLINAVINVVIIYAAYSLFLFVHKK